MENPSTNTTARVVVAVMWLVFASAFFLPDSTLSTIGRIAFFGMAGVHVVEFFVYRPLLSRVPGTLSSHFVSTLVFGYVYYQEVRAQVGDEVTP